MCIFCGDGRRTAEFEYFDDGFSLGARSTRCGQAKWMPLWVPYHAHRGNQQNGKFRLFECLKHAPLDWWTISEGMFQIYHDIHITIDPDSKPLFANMNVDVAAAFRDAPLV